VSPAEPRLEETVSVSVRAVLERTKMRLSVIACATGIPLSTRHTAASTTSVESMFTSLVPVPDEGNRGLVLPAAGRTAKQVIEPLDNRA